MPKKASSPTSKLKHNKRLSASSAGEARVRVVYARLCYLLAALMVSLFTYLYVAGYSSKILIMVGIIALIAFSSLVTTAHYLVQTRHTIASRIDLFRHLRKLLPLAVLIGAFICLLAVLLFVILLGCSNLHAVAFEGLLGVFIVAIASLVGLFLVSREARRVAKQIPAVPSIKLGGTILFLLILPTYATTVAYNIAKDQKIEKRNQSYVNSGLWTFIPASLVSPWYLVNKADGMWYLDENSHIAYYDFGQKINTFISQNPYLYKEYRLDSGKVYGDYFILPSKKEDGEAEYTILNNKKTGAIKVTIPQPSQVYDRNGNRYTILPGDSYDASSSDYLKQGKNEDTVLMGIYVSINQGYSHYQYIEIDLASGKIKELDKQSYNDADYYSGASNGAAPGTSRRYRINSNFYIINNETGAKVKQPSRSAYCKISGGENYLICDTEDLEWWPDKSKKGFVYWSLSELIK
ncbi:MAG TPA: hypothetical protein PLX55_01005 [bacterium]|jgi:hypothetical protein|nr:hypothetical protein [bacterium]